MKVLKRIYLFNFLPVLYKGIKSLFAAELATAETVVSVEVRVQVVEVSYHLKAP
jgi:hypothetical protein